MSLLGKTLLSFIQNHNYNGVVGWLRLKSKPAPQTGGNGMGVPNAQYDAVVVDNYNLNLRIRGLEGEVSGLKAERDGLQQQIKQYNDRIKELESTLAKANELIDKLSNDTTSTTLTKQIEKLQSRIAELENSTPTTLSSYSIGELISAVIKKLFNKEV